MTLTPDVLYERRNFKKQLYIWKALALLFVFVTLFVISSKNHESSGGDFIARIDIEDIILENNKRAEKLKKIAENKNVKAVIFRINSPGGTSYGGEQLYNAIRLISQHKPTISIIGTVAASGGYMVAIASDYIIAGKTSLTGSIGVIMQGFDARDLLIKKIGVTPYSFKSSELKASPSPFEEVTPKVKEAIELSIKDTFTVFKTMVKERRDLSNEELDVVSDGRIFTGVQAKDLKLIDNLGDEEEALSWLREKKNVPEKLKIKDFKIDDKNRYLEEIINTKSIHNFLLNFITNNQFLTIWK